MNTFKKKLGTDFPHDLAISILRTQEPKYLFRKDICNPMLIAAKFTVAQTYATQVSKNILQDKETT